MKNIHVLPTDKPSRLFKDDFNKLFLSINIDIEQNHFQPQHIYITSNEEIKEGDFILVNESTVYFYNPYQTGKKINIPSMSILMEDDKKVILTDNEELINDGVQAINDEFLEWFVKNSSCEFVEVAELMKDGNPSTHDIYQIIIPKEEPKQDYEYVGECKGNNGNGCFMDSPGHDCGCYQRVLIKPKEEAIQFENQYDFESRIINKVWDEDEPKQESLEEAAERLFKCYSNNTSLSEGHYDYLMDKEDFMEASIEVAKWQEQRMYSEENVNKLITIIEWYDQNGDVRPSYDKESDGLSLWEWFEQFKKK